MKLAHGSGANEGFFGAADEDAPGATHLLIF